MAQVLLADRLAALGWAVTVRSGGMLGDGEQPCPQAVSVMAGYGLDISAHRSRRAGTEDFERADLTLAMARENLRYAVVEAPAVWPRAFTVKELVRRGEGIGARLPGEGLAGWLARAHRGRERAALLGESADDDVADPIGAPRRAYTETAAVLSGLVGQLVDLCWARAEATGRR